MNVPTVTHGDMLSDPALFEHMQRVAKLFVASSLIPDHLKKNGGADAFLALQIARDRNESPVAVMQNIYVVKGKAGWLAQYMIARANKSGAFKGKIRWRTEGTGDAMKVTAYAIDADTGEELDATVSMAMARAEGWTANDKYKTMAEHMLRWRSATMLVRLYCPEVLHGMSTADELEDMAASGRLKDVTAEGTASVADEVANVLSSVAADEASTQAPEDRGQAGGMPPVAGGVDDQGPAGRPAPVDDELKTPGFLQRRNWRPTNVVGQDNVTDAIVNLYSACNTEQDIADLQHANHDRFSTFSARNKARFEAAETQRRLELGIA